LRVLTVVAVLAAIGVGIAIPLLFGEETDYALSRADVERQLREDLLRVAPPSAQRPDSVRCRGEGNTTYRCTVAYRGDSQGEEEFFGYDIGVPAYPPSPMERQLQLFLLSQTTEP
jgi:hypothetical protein